MARQVFVLVGTNKGAFIYSADAERRDWRLTGPHLSGWEVYSLLGDSRQGRQRLFAGTSHMAYGPTLRVSDDLGATWTQLSPGPCYSKESGFSLKRIWQMVPGHGSEPDTLFAGVDEAGLFASRDGGLTWGEVEGLTRHASRSQWTPGGGGLCLHTIVVDTINPRRMWVGISAVGVFRTVDGGESWRLCNRGLSRAPSSAPEGELGCNVHKLVQDPVEPDTLYSQAHDGLYRSSDAGESWSAFEEGLPGRFGFPLGVAATGDLFSIPVDAGTRCFIDGRLAVYRSRCGSDGWEPMRRGLPAAPHYVGVLRDGLAVDPLEPAGVYFGTTQGDLFFSPDGGENWDRLPGQFSRILSVKTWTVTA